MAVRDLREREDGLLANVGDRILDRGGQRVDR